MWHEERKGRTGKGISADKVKRIFKILFGHHEMAESSKKKVIGGTQIHKVGRKCSQ